MDISTGNWFEYLREEVLTEGLRDIGLPEIIVDFIEEGMPNAPEKSKTYAGNNWKEHKLGNPGYIDSVQQNWLNQMERMFPDQIQLPRATHSPVAARTVEPYDASAVRTTPRATYDDETIEQNKKIAFVADNIKQAWAKPAGTWRKTFMKALKALSKAGVPSEKVEVVKEYINEQMLGEWRTYWGRYNELFSWLNDEPTNYELIKGDDIDNAYNTALQDLENREDPDNIIHTFEDGSYWYNLQVSNCSVEGERMGHCGSDSRGVLVSLRKKEGKRKASSSYVTMTWDSDTLYQIKGRSNDAPPMEMWDHIEWFIRNRNISSVQETGEHSNDEEGFREMNEYLQGRNSNVNFMGAVDEGAIQEAIDEAVRTYNDNAENSSIYGELSGPEDHGGEYYSVQMNGDGSLEINLGWPGFELRNNEYTPTIMANDTTQDDRYETIPENTWGSEARDFTSELDLDEIGYELPGETEIEWEVKMLTGAQPEGEDIDPDYPATAHLVVSFRCYEYESVEDEDDASRIAENFASEVQSGFEDKYDEIKEEIRTKLAQEGYSVKTAYDRDRGEMSEYELDHWNIYTDKAGLEFWFRPESSADTLVEYGDMPMILKMWGQSLGGGHIDHLYSRAFGRATTGYSRNAARYGNPDLDRNMARTLERLYKKNKETNATGQEQLPFGDKYTAKHVPIVLAKDSRFVIQGAASYNNSGQGSGAYPKMPIGWRYTIGVDSSASPEEVQTVKDIVRYFNANPQLVVDAAKETIDIALEGSISLAEATKADVMSGKIVYATIQNIDSMLAAQVASGSDEWAERKVAMARWINQNFEQMNEPEKHVAWYDYLSPIRQNQFNMAREGEIEPEGDDAGKPIRWNEKVQEQMKRMRAYSGTVRNYGGVQRGEPQLGPPSMSRFPAQESVEQQIDRIDKLLQEKDATYDLRLYSIKIDVAISKDIGGEIQETQTEIRGIDGVTTVRTVGDTNDVGTSQVGTYEIKFELLGNLGRVKYRDRILIPGLMKVKGLRVLRVSPIHRTNAQGTIRTVREELVEYGGISNFGGGVSSLGAMAGRGSRGIKMNTPRSSLQDVLDDWAEGGVKLYDEMAPNDHMAYHVMYPVEELINADLMSRTFRAPMDAFDGMYQNFIKNGPNAPVYIALGQNGRAKITGNEDIVWFAKRAGLKEVPVFFSYQRQV